MSLLAGIIVAAIYPVVEHLLACRIPTSEACTWGKALMPVTATVTVLLGLGLGAFIHLVRKIRRDARVGAPEA